MPALRQVRPCQWAHSLQLLHRALLDSGDRQAAVATCHVQLQAGRGGHECECAAGCRPQRPTMGASPTVQQVPACSKTKHRGRCRGPPAPELLLHPSNVPTAHLAIQPAGGGCRPRLPQRWLAIRRHQTAPPVLARAEGKDLAAVGAEHLATAPCLSFTLVTTEVLKPPAHGVAQGGQSMSRAERGRQRPCAVTVLLQNTSAHLQCTQCLWSPQPRPARPWGPGSCLGSGPSPICK